MAESPTVPTFTRDARSAAAGLIRSRLRRSQANLLRSPGAALCRHLDGSKSCSAVIDPELVTEDFQELDRDQQRAFPETRWLTEDAFWQDEFRVNRPVPSRVEDLVIYEPHVGGLGSGRLDENGQPVAGDLGDAYNLLDYLVEASIWWLLKFLQQCRSGCRLSIRSYAGQETL